MRALVEKIIEKAYGEDAGAGEKLGN